MTTPVGTQNRRILKQIDDLLEGKAVKDIQSYEINNRALTKMTVEELLRWKAVYTNLVLGEQGELFGSLSFE